MPGPLKSLLIAIALLGIATTAVFHASGALNALDAHVAATLRHGIVTSPPMPISSRVLAFGVQSFRSLQGDMELFQAMHLTGGLCLAGAACFLAVLGYARAREDDYRIASAIFAATTLLFGSGFSQLSMEGGSFGTLVLLLSAAVASSVLSRHASLVTGLLVGLAVSEHPLVLFLVPGFLLLRRPDSSVAFWPGFAAGLLALTFPMLDGAGSPYVHETPPAEVYSLAPWLGTPLFWTFASPASWGGGFLSLLAALWSHLGPLGLGVTAVATFRLFKDRSFSELALPGIPTVALVVGETPHEPLLASLAAWAWLTTSLPSLGDLLQRFLASSASTRAVRASGIAVIAGFVFLALNVREIDRSAERGIEWARGAFDGLPGDAVLLTGNPVHLALASEGARDDIHVIYRDAPSTYHASRGAPEISVPAEVQIPSERLDPNALLEIVRWNHRKRKIFIDATLFFDARVRETLKQRGFGFRPWGLAYLVRTREGVADMPAEEWLAGAILWDEFDLFPESKASPLRNDLSGQDFFARTLLQSGAVHLELGDHDNAERDFLLALSHPSCNHTVAAFGLAQVHEAEQRFDEAIATLQSFIDEEDPAAWTALRLLSAVQKRVGQHQEAFRSLERAYRIMPTQLVNERKNMRAMLESMKATL